MSDALPAPPTWPPVLWREWRNSREEPYAAHLYALLRHTRSGPCVYTCWAKNALVCAAGGFLLGLVLACCLTGQPALGAGSIMLCSWAAGLLGGTVGALLETLLTLRGPAPPTWDDWFRHQSPVWDRATTRRHLVAEGLLGAVAGLWYAEMTYFAARDTTKTIGFAVLLALTWAFMLGAAVRNNRQYLLTVVLLGSALTSTTALLVCPDLLTWDLTTAKMGGLGILVVGLVGVAWLVELTNQAAEGRTAARAWHWRRLWWWWRPPRPAVQAVGAALQAAYAQQAAAAPQHANGLLRLPPAQPPAGDSANSAALVAALRDASWEQALPLSLRLVAEGGAAVPPLLALRGSPALTPARRDTVVGVLRAIAQETAPLRAQYRDLLCPHCLVRFARLPLPLGGRPRHYYACRQCSQSREQRGWRGTLTAVLDTTMTAPEVQHGSELRVNCLPRPDLGDYDQVAIVHATAEDIERFVVQVGNDTDPARRRRWRRCRVRVAPECRLSASSRRLLASALGPLQE